jgi:hypothetical protein
MRKKIKFGKIPVNARVNIDYTGKEPKVKFGYPSKNAVEQNYELVFPFVIIIMFAVFLLINYYGLPFIETHEKFPSSCEFTNFYEDNLIKNVSFFCDNGLNKTIKFTEQVRYINPYLKDFIEFGEVDGYEVVDKKYSVKTNAVAALLFLSAIVFFVFVLPALLAKPITKILVKNKLFQEKIPDIQKVLSGRGYLAVFKKVPDNLIIEIPLFRNVQLDYHATKEFSKHLLKVEIREHPFWRVIKKKGRLKKKRNVTYWYAKFYFKEKPRSGKLEVLFK